MNPQTTLDKRRDQRVEFFLIPVEREQLPVWVFKPEQDVMGHAGVVANVSKGGLQILTHAESPLQDSRYQLKLILDEGQGVQPFSAQLRRAWSESLTALVHVNGFEYLDSNNAAAEFLSNFELFAKRKVWIRCVLLPL